MSDPRERVRVRVSGRVQGVWFRASTQQEARALELVGWVRNLQNGDVELEAQGRPESLEELLSWLRDGPPQARVEGVDVRWVEPVSHETGFEIRR